MGTHGICRGDLRSKPRFPFPFLRPPNTPSHTPMLPFICHLCIYIWESKHTLDTYALTHVITNPSPSLPFSVFCLGVERFDIHVYLVVKVRGPLEDAPANLHDGRDGHEQRQDPHQGPHLIMIHAVVGRMDEWLVKGWRCGRT